VEGSDKGVADWTIIRIDFVCAGYPSSVRWERLIAVGREGSIGNTLIDLLET